MIYRVIFLLIGLAQAVGAQTTIQLQVNAGTSTGLMPPIWRDHYEAQLMNGYGGNPALTGNHQLYITDPAFQAEMTRLQPRFIRISLGRIDNPPDTNYYSSNTAVLRNLPYEFYKGPNTMAGANNPANYDFSYVDSMVHLVQQMGAEPFLTLDYMPFTLSSDTVPDYNGLLALFYYLAYDNTIRNAPPASNAVYGRVMYHLIHHCYSSLGARYFEHWNEPDQQWLNPVYAHFYWSGDQYQLYDAYAAIADEVSADTALASHIKLGGCSFALYSFMNAMPQYFLQSVQANNDKFDFLSFHPYSDTQFRGGYDSAKVALVTSWRNTYSPSAELIVAEWGRIDPNSDTWGDLDYGLDKCCHQVDMLNRGVTMAHDVCLFDADTASDNFKSPGMYRVGPVQPKPTAYAACNMNKLNDALNRLPLTINPGMYALAGRNNAADKVVIVLPAEKPDSATSNTVLLQVSNLPWGNAPYYDYRYELTEQSYAAGVMFNLTQSGMQTGSSYADSLTYPGTGNSGRLIIWELSTAPLSMEHSWPGEPEGLHIFPNPGSHDFTVSVSPESGSVGLIRIYSVTGQLLVEAGAETAAPQIQLNPDLLPGMYLMRVYTEKGVSEGKLVIQQ